MSKITYPSGEISNLGTIVSDNTVPFVKNGDGGYGGVLFGLAKGNPTPWTLGSTTTSVKDVKGNHNSRQISIQPRISNSGNLLPHNSSDKYISAIYGSWIDNYENQRFKLSRNSVPYSPVNEILVFQANVKKKHDIYSNTDLVRVDPSIISTDPVEPKFIDVKVERTSEWIDGAGITAPSYSTNAYIWDGNSLLASHTGDIYYASGYTGAFESIDVGADITWRGVEVVYYSSDILKYTYATRLSVSIGGIIGTISIPLIGEFRTAIMAAAKLKTYVSIRFMVGFTRGSLDGALPLPTLTVRDGLKTCLLHASDFLPEETVVSPDGEFVILKFNRLTKVDVLFDNVEHGFDYISDENNEIRVNRRDKKFTMGGVLQITQKHRLRNSGKNKTYTFTIPDTVAPDQPTFTSATRNIIYGTGTRNDIVYAEKDGVVIGSATILTNGTYEIILSNIVLNNGDSISLYTKDAANNKSAVTEVLIDSVSEENRIEATLNSDIMQQIGKHG